jgi:hypothetical protein
MSFNHASRVPSWSPVTKGVRYGGVDEADMSRWLRWCREVPLQSPLPSRFPHSHAISMPEDGYS